MEKIKFPFVIRLTAGLISIFLLGYLLYIGKFILAPFFLACLFALLFLPLARFLERKLRFHRLLSSLCCVLFIVIIGGGIAALFGTRISNLGQDIPKLEEQFAAVFQDLQHTLSAKFNISMHQQTEYIDQGFQKLMASPGSILSGTLSAFSSVFGFFVFSIIFFFFILSYRGVLHSFLQDIFPDSHHDTVEQTLEEVQKVSGNYLIGLCIQIVIISVLTSTLLLVFGIKYAILLGIFSGLINIVPYVGITFSGIMSCLMAFATVSPVTALYVGIGYIVIHAIDGNIIFPFIIGSRAEINPLFSFLGILIGASLWGISGMFLSLPALAILKIIARNVDPLKSFGQLLSDP